MNEFENLNLQDKYKLTFRGPLAREVLQDIVLRTCSYGSTIDPGNAAQIAQYNVAVDILAMAGIHPQQMLAAQYREPGSAGKTNTVVVKQPFARRLIVMLGIGELPPSES